MILAKLTCEDCQRSSAAVHEVKDYKPSSEIFPIKLIVCPSVSRWFVVPDKLRSSTKYPGVKFSNLSDIIKADSLHSPTEGLVKEKSSFISLWTGPYIIAILSQVLPNIVKSQAAAEASSSFFVLMSLFTSLVYGKLTWFQFGAAVWFPDPQTTIVFTLEPK